MNTLYDTLYIKQVWREAAIITCTAADMPSLSGTRGSHMYPMASSNANTGTLFCCSRSSAQLPGDDTRPKIYKTKIEL